MVKRFHVLCTATPLFNNPHHGTTLLTCEVSDLLRQNSVRREQINQRDEQRRSRGRHPATAAAAPDTSVAPSTHSTALIDPLSPIPTPCFGCGGAAPAASLNAVPPHVALSALRNMRSAPIHGDSAKPLLCSVDNVFPSCRNQQPPELASSSLSVCVYRC